jgi:hypothetical protein
VSAAVADGDSTVAPYRPDMSTPTDDGGGPRSRSSVLSSALRAVWALDILVLALLVAGLVLSPSPLLSSTTFVVLLVTCVALWLVHVADVRAHREDDRHDPELQRTRERRGF